MNKKELRLLYKSKRNLLTTAEVEQLDHSIFSRLKQLDWSAVKYVHVFLTISRLKEPNTKWFMEWMRETFPKTQLVISRSNFDTGKMDNFLYNDDVILVENDWGIPEPVNGISIDEKMIDAVLVPLLVADHEGNRVGYGKGFYDRFLSLCRSDVKTIGLSFFDPIDKIDDVEAWDYSLDYCVTPSATYSYN